MDSPWPVVLNNEPVNSLNPGSDKHLISRHSIATWSSIQLMSIKETIKKDKMSWSNQSNSPKKYRKKYVENTKENIHFDIWA